MQRQGQNTREMNIPKRINAKDNNGSKVSPFKIDTVDDTKGVGAGKPKMKGNLGPMKKSTFMNNLQNDKQKEQWKKFGKELILIMCCLSSLKTRISIHLIWELMRSHKDLSI